jgi:hypothetical protein
VTVHDFQVPMCHEFDVHFHFASDGLKPYYALDRVRKDWGDRWRSEGKPTVTFDFRGEKWKATLDYDSQPLRPWSDPSYRLETTPLFRIYFVACDELYDGERPDQSQRVRGGTMTVRPRWPNMRKDDGQKVRGYMDLGKPYLDVQVQASNVVFEDYLDLVRETAGALGVSSSYLRDPERSSNINDAAVYVRPKRDFSGPVHAADGPIARMHNLMMSDREGYRSHHADHRKIPGYHVAAQIDDDRAGKLIRGHQLGKEVKHYYPKDPEGRDPDDPLYHPKVEVSYQTSVTDATVYWQREDGLDLQDLHRELEETLFNVLDWSDLSVGADSDIYEEDAYYNPTRTEERSRKLVDCPLPRIEDEQERTVIELWGEMTDSDRAVTEYLLSDGGSVSPQEAAEETGYSYRTVRRVIERMEQLIEHAYGELSIGSDYMAQEMLQRMRASAENFKQAAETGVMEVADAVNERGRTAWDKWRRRYNVTIQDGRTNARKVLKIGYKVEDLQEARNLLREATTAYRDSRDDPAGLSGIQAVITFVDGTRETIVDLPGFAWRNTSADSRRSAADMMEDKYGTSDPDKIPSSERGSSTVG